MYVEASSRVPSRGRVIGVPTYWGALVAPLDDATPGALTAPRSVVGPAVAV